ncbi:hypothetical protein TD95_002773 [Thielaviopsis punctulata]|uniref:Endo-1,4-beta-xylanase n=1 Tax=Thielaviopsis punctulata TaxID=72032 RepID=A0A0F4ZF04_9PEZI|nr:hypothetical protein TD95_002773 [Thielaviopsis punctulata]
MKVLSALASLLSVTGVLAAPMADAPAGPVQVFGRAHDAAFYNKINEMMNRNSTEPEIDARDSTKTITYSTDGVDAAGFYYSMYNANGASAKLTEYSDSGRWGLTWNSKVEFLAGKGFRSSTPRSISWGGYMNANGDYTLAIYGWTTNPVTEWYVVESHGTGTPGNGNPLGTVSDNGGVYDVYDLYYSNVPEIYGATSFHQYWSVRRGNVATGTVNVAAHFNRWRQLGLNPGTPIFQMVTLEGFVSSGSLDFTVQH